MTQIDRELARREAGSGRISFGPLNDFPEKVIQFGEGNFLRAFVDWMIDALNARGLFGGSIVVVQPIETGVCELLNRQGGCYTLVLRGLQEGKSVERTQVITAIRRGLNPYEDWAGFLALAQKESVRYVVSNTTEAGIAYVSQPQPAGACPETFPAKVTAMLWERFVTFEGDVEQGLVFLPCELIDQNAETLRKIVHRHAEDWQLGEAFEAWVDAACLFCNTLVDRIVPGYPKEEAAGIGRRLGYEDALLVTAEPFHLWVIEGPKRLAEELPFERIGLNVIWTDDMSPYRTRKVRILNGAHTCSVLAAFLGGLDTVGEMVNDDSFGRFLQRAIFDEIIPSLGSEVPGGEEFARSVLERFGNPFIRHELLSISLNSVSKWKVRVLPSLLGYLKEKGTCPKCLTFSLAAMFRFYDGQPEGERLLQGRRKDGHYPIRDDAAVLEKFRNAWAGYHAGDDLGVLVKTLLADEGLWEQNLAELPGLPEQVTMDLRNLLSVGARAAIELLLVEEHDA